MELPKQADTVIVGAGAAGLWAAGVLARGGRAPLLLEKTRRTGTKVLASGGTRCNLTTTLGPQDAAALFGGRQARFVLPAMRHLPPAEVRARFASWGVPSVTAPLEKVFPASQRAKDVRDALEREALSAGARLHLNCGLRSLAGGPDGWRLQLGEGRELLARRVLLCPGGKSYPLTGTTGDGYGWLRDLDLPQVEPVPALAPLTSPEAWVHALTGIALQGSTVQLLDPDGRLVAERERPFVFTHRGLSGPGAMDVSAPLARAAAAGSATVSAGGKPRAQGWRVRLDLVPGCDREGLRKALVSATQGSGRPRVSRVLRPLCSEPLAKRLLAAVSQQAGLDTPDPPVQGIPKAARHALIETLKGLAVPVDGTRGYDQAEVTAGGLDLRALNPRSYAVNGRPGLYVFGELLDLDGPIGGLNFQAAFAGADLAATHVLQDA